MRLRAEDPQTVASECGTSLQMLSIHYAFAIEDLRQHGPRPADVEWRAAGAAISKWHSHGKAPSSATDEEGRHRRRMLFAWLAARRRRSRAR